MNTSFFSAAIHYHSIIHLCLQVTLKNLPVYWIDSLLHCVPCPCNCTYGTSDLSFLLLLVIMDTLGLVISYCPLVSVIIVVVSAADSSVCTDSMLCHLIWARRRWEVDWRTSVSWPGESRQHHQRVHQQCHWSGQSIRNFGCSSNPAASVLVTAGGAGFTSYPWRC